MNPQCMEAQANKKTKLVLSKEIKASETYLKARTEKGTEGWIPLKAITEALTNSIISTIKELEVTKEE